jgi:hypothetical protein
MLAGVRATTGQAGAVNHRLSREVEPMLRVITEKSGDRCRLELHGSLGGQWVGLLDQHWRTFVAAGPSANVVVDLSNVDFIDPDGERLLRRMADAGVEFVVSGCLNRYVVEQLEASRPTAREGTSR